MSDTLLQKEAHARIAFFSYLSNNLEVQKIHQHSRTFNLVASTT